MIIIHDKRLPSEYIKALTDEFPSAFLHPFGGPGDSCSDKVYESILYHPDIYFFQLDEKTVIHAPGLPEEELYPLRNPGINLIKGEGDPRGLYPDTARYNAARVGEFLFHNLQYTDSVILEKAHKAGLKLVNVNQGYARCSVLALSEEALITADKAIGEAASIRGIDVLTISNGSILLPGEEYGFIGGAGGKTPGGAVVMLGGVNHHPQVQRLKRFIEKHGVRYIDSENLPLFDAGGLFLMP